jgi:hypothetical protein
MAGLLVNRKAADVAVPHVLYRGVIDEFAGGRAVAAFGREKVVQLSIEAEHAAARHLSIIARAA